MSNQLTSNAKALRLFFTDDVYLVNNNVQTAFVEPVKRIGDLPQPEVVNAKVEAKVETQPEVLTTIVQEPMPELRKEFDFKFLGKNQQQILILVNDKHNEVSTERGRELLRKLVNAIGLTAKDFALVNYANYETALFEDLQQFFGCKTLLSFGVSSQQLALAEQPLNQLVNHKQAKLIYTKNLDDLDIDPASKKALWVSLQQLK